jgi:Tol biopolymer transport system component
LIRAEINPPGATRVAQGIALSPDAHTLAVVTEAAGTSRLWVRSLESLATRELPGTEGATFPFWSPDSQSIGFFAAGKLKRVAITGGMPAVICDVGRGRGGSWNAQDTIIFNSVNDGPLLRVSATGGVPEAVTAVNKEKGENSHRWPWFLPDGQRFLYYVRAEDAGVEGLYLGSLDDRREKRRLLQTRSNGVYINGARPSSGYLAWVQQGNLVAQPMDPTTIRLSGRPVSLAENVVLEPALRIADIAAAADVLVYRAGEEPSRQLTWYDREGKVVSTLGAPEAWLTMRMSPDGSQILVSRPFSANRWGGMGIIDLATGIATPFLAAFPGSWSPDGRKIAYTWSASGAPNIYVKPVATRVEGTRLTQSGNSQSVLDWSHDGRFLLYVEHSNDISTGLQSNLMIAPTSGEGRPIRYAATSTREPKAQFSPDGSWIAYTSAEDGRTQVYVESFPSGKGKWQVSHTGGDHPRWASDGRELFYLTGDGTLMAVPIRPNSLPSHFGIPTALFKVQVSSTYFAGSPYDVAAGGRILALAYSGERRSSLTMLLNWTQLLRNNKGL